MSEEKKMSVGETIFWGLLCGALAAPVERYIHCVLDSSACHRCHAKKDRPQHQEPPKAKQGPGVGRPDVGRKHGSLNNDKPSDPKVVPDRLNQLPHGERLS